MKIDENQFFVTKRGAPVLQLNYLVPCNNKSQDYSMIENIYKSILPCITESEDYSKIISFYKISPIFQTFWVFRPINLFSPHKSPINRFSIVRPICPYVGLPVTPCDSKVMTDCCITHFTSPSFFWLAYICTQYFFNGKFGSSSPAFGLVSSD